MITEVHDMSVISADEEVLKYARIGAEATLKELLRNAGEVRDFLGRIAPRSAWGDGKPAIVPGQEPVPDQPVAVATPVARPKGGKKSAKAPKAKHKKATPVWTDAMRKAVSERMKKYWAKRRAKEARAAK